MANEKKSSEPKPIEAPLRDGEDESITVARVAVDPAVQAANTASHFVQNFGDLEVADLVEVLKEQTSAATEGEMGRAEEMLAAQAHTLDGIFNALAIRAANNLGHYPDTVATYLKLALRAQSQSRTTWETLSTIKHPPMANYVGQANIANGPQQINNNSSHAREIGNPPNEQLGHQHGNEWLDTGASSKAGAADKGLEAVGTFDRAKN